ncbi:MAG: hypothetical protein ACJZ9K_05385 [Alphaproteobacteria bacterium]
MSEVLKKLKKCLELVKQGKVDPIPVAKRDIKEATQTLDDLRDGSYYREGCIYSHRLLYDILEAHKN